jgi:DNA topoisomerase IB
VNEYLSVISRREVTAKDFRTWAGTILAVLALRELNAERPTKTYCVQVVKQVAKQLGNTPAVCCKCYIHPAVLESSLEGSMRFRWANSEATPAAGMWAIERELIRFLAARSRKRRPPATLKAILTASLRAAK